MTQEAFIYSRYIVMLDKKSPGATLFVAFYDDCFNLHHQGKHKIPFEYLKYNKHFAFKQGLFLFSGT